MRRLATAGPSSQPCETPAPETTPPKPLVARAYLAAHPEKLADKSFVLDLAYEEYCQRTEDGSAVDPNAFCAEFPAFQSSLRRLLEAHCFLGNNLDLLRPSEPIAWPESGQAFLGFTLLQELGRGTFARVFLATEPALGHRRVALKIAIHGDAEAQTLGRLSHPNVVPIHSVQTDAATGLTAICMPYLGSATLRDLLDQLRQGPELPRQSKFILDAATRKVPELESLPRADARHPFQRWSYVDGVLGLAIPLADALEFIHSQGIYHRDLKPSNILLCPDGTPRLLDFNLSGDAQRAEQQLGGTLPYMAPEHLRATDPDVPPGRQPLDGRADIYALGVILYELLTGIHPFGPVPQSIAVRSLRELLLARQQAGAASVRRHHPAVDGRLARLIERCLAHEPEERPASAAVLARELRRCASWPGRLRRWSPRQRWLAASGVAAVLLGTLSAGQAWRARSEDADHPRRVGLAALELGKYDEAVRALSTYLEQNPASGPVLAARGRALEILGQDTAATRDYLKARDCLEDGPTLAHIGYYLSQHTQSHLEALQCYRRALDTGYVSARLLNDLGYCCVQLGKFDEAESYLNDALRLDPQLQAAYHNRAIVALYRAAQRRGSSLAAGLADIRQAIEIGPASAELYADAARLHAYAAAHDPHSREQALKYLESAVNLGADPAVLSRDRFFRHLKAEPRFQSLLHKPAQTPFTLAAARMLEP